MGYCRKCGTPIDEERVSFCPSCGSNVNETVEIVEAEKPEFPMKWFKFTIYFRYFFGAFMGLLNAVQLFTGSVYQGNAAAVYSVYDGMKGLDMLYGLFYLGCAVWMIVLRFKFAGFKHDAIKHFVLLNVALLAGQLLYLIVASAITGLVLIDGSAIGSLLGTGIGFALEYVYYNKRRVLFTN